MSNSKSVSIDKICIGEAAPGCRKVDPILIADGVRRQFGGLTAVDVEHVEIPRGLITALIGPNGAGKTTLLRLIAGIFVPDEGTIERNSDVSALLDSGYGMVDSLTARENCVSRLIVGGVSKREIPEIIDWVEDFVEIGAGCTIDRGVTHDTIIGQGTKMDNMVHIGHDVVVGKNCLFAAQVGIAGATTVEDGVILWGQVGVNKTINIGKNAIVMGQSGVANSLEGGKTYFGYTAEEAISKRREMIWIRRIPEIWNMIKQLQEKKSEG